MTASLASQRPTTGTEGAPAADKPADYYSHARREMLAFFPAQVERVLDVGCANGRFGELVKSVFPGCEVWGVDPVAEAHALAARVLDKAVHGFFDAAAGLPEAHFDVVVFNDSLEHVPDHDAALALAKRVLKPGGSVVASIPNIRYWPHVQQYLIEGEWRYEQEGVLDRTHLRFFTRKSIVRTFGEAGFTVGRLEGIHPCWTGLKFRLVRMLFGDRVSDMPFKQFALNAIKPAPPR